MLSIPRSAQQVRQQWARVPGYRPSLWLAGDILDFSKIEAHSLELRPAALDLRATLEAALALVAADAERKGLALAYTNFTADVAAASFWGDPLRIRQVCRAPSFPSPLCLPASTAAGRLSAGACQLISSRLRYTATKVNSSRLCYTATDLPGLCHLLVLWQILSRGRSMPDDSRSCHGADPTRFQSI